jgi:hypothetical protein
MLNRIFYKKPKEEDKTEEDKPAGLWASSEEFDEAWKRRIAVMASSIHGPCSVADFGCGMMWLESRLPQGSTYHPFDFVRRDERTVVLDLNRDPLPPVSIEVAFLSGVLEYVEDVAAFSRQLAAAGFRKIILSYCTLEKFQDVDERKNLNWVSHVSLFDLLGLFLVDYDLVHIDDVNNNSIFVFDRKSYEDRTV